MVTLLWAFVTLLLRFGGSLFPSSVPPTYLALLGIPVATALGAKAITSQASDTKSMLSSPSGWSGLGQIFSDDSGSVDLLDSEYFLFGLVLLAYFILAFIRVRASVKNSAADFVLPTLPGSLLTLSGISAAGYLGKKALSSSGNQIPIGGSLPLAAASDVSLPGGGTVTLKSPGQITIFPGVTYTWKTSGTAETAFGGTIGLTADSQLRVDRGTKVTGPALLKIKAVKQTEVLVSDGAVARNEDGTPAADGASHGKIVPVNGTVTFNKANCSLIVVSSPDPIGPEFEFPADAVIRYDAAGTATVTSDSAAGTVSAGATIGQKGNNGVTFPKGGSYFLSSDMPPGKTNAPPGAVVELKPAVGNTPAVTITVASDVELDMLNLTVITFPDGSETVTADAKTLAITKTTLTLPSGGEIDIDPGSGDVVAARAPAGAIVQVFSAGQNDAPGTVTPVQSNA
jgi:hypothetical protein